MRKLIYSVNLSLDGCCDHEKLSPGEDTHDYFTGLMQETGVMVYGRKTYELMVPFWPDMAKNNAGDTQAMNDFAKAFDAVHKVVFSRSLEKVEDKNTTLFRTGLGEEIIKLKQQPGKDIMVGGVDVPKQLIKLSLVDEFIFVVHPAIAGAGRRLFDDLTMQEALHTRLVDTKVFTSGSVALRYVKE